MYNGETLFHGPLLQGLREATSITSDALDARCVEVSLDAAQAGQFGDTRSVIDGFAADVMMQAALVWVRETHGFACLPSGFASMEWYRSLPAGGEYFLSLRITSSTATTVIATCTMHDQAGTAYMVGRDLTLVINKTLKYGSGAAPQAATGAVATNGVKGFAAQPKGSKLTAEIDYQRSQAVKYAATGKPLLWDFDDLLMYAEGDIAPVFNKHLSGTHPPWSVVDQYRRRVRLPQREYLLCSRVTKMEATTGKYEPCKMTTEYDLPYDGELSEGGDVPWAVLVESGQADLMLISYLGIDFQCKSERVYRLLDTTLTFYGVAKEGETLCYDIQINSFAKQEGMVTMFFFSYNCYVDGKLLIEMRNGVAGFFTEKELDEGKGVVWTGADKKAREKNFANQKDIAPYLLSPSSKTTFSQAEMQQLSGAGHLPGTWEQILGPGSAGVAHKLCARKMLMIDRVTHVMPRGGAHGLGLLVGEKFLERDDWYFPCHFKDDEVMAGSLVSDGCSQLLKLYMIWLGLHKAVEGLTFRPVNGQMNKVRCRGQISPHKGKLVYWVEVNDIGFDKVTGYPYARADVNIIDIDYEKGQTFDHPDEASLLAALKEYGLGNTTRKIVVDFKGVALQMEGTLAPGHPTRGGGTTAMTTAAPARGPVISGYDVGGLHLSGGFRGPMPPAEYMSWGKPLKPSIAGGLTWHPLAGKNGNPTPGFTPTPYPPRPIAFIPFPGNPHDNNHTPGVLPLSWVNMCEFMCNRLSQCLGDEYSRFDVSTSSRSPAFDLAFTTRVISVTGMESDPGNNKWYNVDCNPGTGTMIAEFDCPADAWFFEGSSRSDFMPYSILMEIALQTCGVLTTWNKAPLTLARTCDRDNILFRNLDATAKLLRNVDLRGKTIRNESTATGYSMLGEMGVQKFKTKLTIDGGEPFYEVDSSFGWFIPEVFEKQIGLDGGKTTPAWHLVPKNAAPQPEVYSLPTEEARIFSKVAGAHSLQRRSAQCSYLDKVSFVANSGMHGKGYAHGFKTVDTRDWFFSCHFWCDSVMPGSLGVESMHQAMELFSVNQGLADGMANPSFEHDHGVTKWKYRGQLVPKNKVLECEVHIKKIERAGGSVTVVADGFLLVDQLRVYSTTDLRIRIVPGAASASVPAPLSAAGSAKVSATDTAALRRALLDTQRDVVVDIPGGGAALVRAVPWSMLGSGSSAFMEQYGVKYPLYTGAMAKGIASADLVIAAGQKGMLASLGAGGLPLHRVSAALDKIQAALPNGPYAVNLIHAPADELLESGGVELFLKRGVRVVEASAFMKLTPWIVRYRVAGLERDASGRTVCRNKVIFKVSRTELATLAMHPPPADIVAKLLAKGLVTAEQAALAPGVTMCDDVAVECDSGGHTDNRHMPVLLPVILAQRDRIAKETGMRVRVGAGGGIGCPEAAAAAYAMGADFIVTGTINQMCRQSGSCDIVRKQLSEAAYSDVTMAPAADMFEMGVDLQVLKKGTMFPARAKKLYELFVKYPSLDAIPADVSARLEKQVFRKPMQTIWDETVAFTLNQLKDPEKIARAERDPKLKMALVFRWYLGLSSAWANGGVADRALDYQVWCGPAIGSFNDFIAGTHLDPLVAGKYPDVHEANVHMLRGAAIMRRCEQLKGDPRLKSIVDPAALARYKPEPLQADRAPAAPLALPMATLAPSNPLTVRSSDSAGFRRALVDTERDVVVDLPGGGAGLVRAVPWSMLGSGSSAFMEQYGVKYPLYTGAMAKGIASADLVIAAGQKGMLASLGAGGLPLHRVSAALDKIQAALPNGPYAVNLIHAPADELLESGGVELFLKRGVRVVEASAFMKLTPWIVRYRVAGLERDASGRTVCRNKVIFKVSRTELATLAMHPPPADIVAKLLAKGLVTAEQAALAPGVTMCDDVAVECDSGGHTDNRHMPVLLPVILAQRDRIAKETGMRVRVGAGGGIGCPEAAAAAYAMGADFIVTGTINQMCRQSGSCDIVRKQLSEAAYSDVTMAPAADMFEMGVDLQVLKKGTMFPARAKKLYELFVKYPSLDAIPADVSARLEKQVFRKPMQTIWDETVAFTLNQLKDPEKIARAERDPKLKMALVFRWYLGLSSAWANGGVADRALDYQVWCGPAIGSFNDFIAGTHLDPLVAGKYPDVHEANVHMLRGAAIMRRAQQVKSDPALSAACDAAVVLARYTPAPF